GIEALRTGFDGHATLDRSDVPLRGPMVPESTPSTMTVRGTADRGVVTGGPIQLVVAAFVAGTCPVRDLVPVETGGLEPFGGKVVPIGLHVIVGVAVRIMCQRGTSFDRERVGRDVHWTEIDGLIERSLPVGVRLTRNAVDQIEVEPDSSIVQKVAGTIHIVGVVGAAECAKDGRK